MRMTYVEAMASAIHMAASADPDVLFLGNGFVGLNVRARESFSAFDEDFADRVVPKPVSELGLAGAAIGASLAGHRAMVDLATADFLFQAFPQIVDEAAPLRYGTNGGASAPATFYAMTGIRGAGGPQHSARPQAMLAGVPGLQVVLPSSPADVHGLLRWSLLHSQDPTVFLTHPQLFGEVEEVDEGADPVPFGRARVRRPGDDVTVVATSIMVPRALAAAERLAADGVSVEVVDPRTLAPLDRATIVQSAARTGRVVVADECPRSFGAAAELACTVTEGCWSALRGPVVRVTPPDVPVPFSAALEAELVVGPDEIAAGVRQVLAADR